MVEWSGSVAFKVDLVHSLTTGYSLTCLILSLRLG